MIFDIIFKQFEYNTYKMMFDTQDTTLTWLTFCSIILINVIFLSTFLVLIWYVITQQYAVLHKYNTIIHLLLILLCVYIITISIYTTSIHQYFETIYTWGIAEPTTTIETVFFLIILNMDCLNLIAGSVIVAMSNYFDKIESQISTSTTNNECAFIIVCHNSSDRIEKTISAILATSTPDECIYIADNGSSVLEQTATRNICNQMRVHYIGIQTGNKTVAQFTVANLINVKSPYVKYIACLDDDTLVAADWDIKHVATHFTNTRVCAVAFPLVAKSQSNFITTAQTIEYLVASINKTAQSRLVSTVFASGGFSCYRLAHFLELVAHHTTEFHGEDFQLGLIAHSLYNQKYLTRSEYHNQHFVITSCTRYVAQTITPSHWIHARDIPIIGRYFQSVCPCCENSLFAQRVFSWDMTRYRFVGKYLKIITSNANLLVKCVMLWELMLITSDFAVIGYVMYFGFYIHHWQSIFQTFIISCVWSTPFFICLNLTLLRKFDIPMFVIMIYSPVYKLVMNTIIKYSAFIACCHDIMSRRKLTPIKNRMQDPKFVNQINKIIMTPVMQQV